MTLWVENDHKRAGDELMRSFGAKIVDVKVVAPKRRLHPNTRGTPDRYYLHVRVGGFWWEAKRIGGVASVEQLDFEAWCLRCSVGYVRGTYEDLGQWLYDHGILQQPLLLAQPPRRA